MPTVPCLNCGAPFERKKTQKYCGLRCAVLHRVDVRGVDECWPWKAAIGSHGYGVFSFDGVMYTSHRASYLAHNGPIPDADGAHGGVVMHDCDYRPCCNPKHLLPGSQAANLEDAARKNRLFTVTDNATAGIVVALKNAGKSLSEIASELSLKKSTVQAIASGRNYRFLERK